MLQVEKMLFDPVTGEADPYPTRAEEYRHYHGEVAWLFDPWSGRKRDPRDIGTDVHGKLICSFRFQKNDIDITYRAYRSLEVANVCR